MNMDEFPDFPELPEKLDGWYVHRFASHAPGRQARGVVWTHYLGFRGLKALAYAAFGVFVFTVIGFLAVVNGSAFWKVLGLALLGLAALIVVRFCQQGTLDFFKRYHWVGLIFRADGTIEPFSMSKVTSVEGFTLRNWVGIEGVQFDKARDWDYNTELAKMNPYAFEDPTDVYFRMSDGSREVVSQHAQGREFSVVLTKALYAARQELITAMEAELSGGGGDRKGIPRQPRPPSVSGSVHDLDLGD